MLVPEPFTAVREHMEVLGPASMAAAAAAAAAILDRIGTISYSHGVYAHQKQSIWLPVQRTARIHTTAPYNREGEIIQTTHSSKLAEQTVFFFQAEDGIRDRDG